MDTKTWNKTEERALTLLAQNIRPEVVAGAIGVTPSAISQLISREDFATELANRKFYTLQAHNQRDSEYDALEDALISKFKETHSLMMKPMEIMKAMQVLNSMKRRGVPATDTALQKSEVVPLALPNIIVNKFTVNINNQVVKAGEQSLVTVPSHKMGLLASENIANEHKEVKELPNETTENITIDDL